VSISFSLRAPIPADYTLIRELIADDNHCGPEGGWGAKLMTRVVIIEKSEDNMRCKFFPDISKTLLNPSKY
jgi:hypothetical protein